MKCVVCGSQRFRESNAVFVCEFGHQVAGVRVEESDETAAFGTARRRISLKRKPSTLSNHPTPTTAASAAASAYPSHLVCECFQAVLRYQTHHLVLARSLPSHTILLVRDLWLLLASHLPLIFPSDPDPNSRDDNNVERDDNVTKDYSRQYNERDDNNVGRDDTSRQYDERKDNARKDSIHIIDPETGERVPVADLKSQHPRLYDLYYSSLPQDDNVQSLDHRSRPAESRISPSYSLVIIFFACSWLRLPVTLADICFWAGNGTIPYLSAPSHIPASLHEQLLKYPGSRFRRLFHPLVHLLIPFIHTII